MKPICYHEGVPYHTPRGTMLRMLDQLHWEAEELRLKLIQPLTTAEIQNAIEVWFESGGASNTVVKLSLDDAAATEVIVLRNDEPA